MPRNRYEWQSRINSVFREYSAMRQAADRLVAETRRDPTLLRGGVKPQNVVDASDRLEGTYLLRLFAEFETGLRHYRRTLKNSRTRTEVLLNLVAARLSVSGRLLADVQQVREYRNSLIHQRDDEMAVVPIREAKRRLCTFFDHLPDRW